MYLCTLEEPLKAEVTKLQQVLAARLEEIAALELDNETLRSDLGYFEHYYHQYLARENLQLKQSANFLKHLERLLGLLKALLRGELPHSLGEQVLVLENKRLAELKAVKGANARQVKLGAGFVVDTLPTSAPRVKITQQEVLKKVYRELARRYHPDLAATEPERLQNSRLMIRINHLYHAGDLERLSSLLDEVHLEDLEQLACSLRAELARLNQRTERAEIVFKNLQAEKHALQHSETAKLWQKFKLAREQGEDLLAALQVSLRQRLELAYADIKQVFGEMEIVVKRYQQQALKALTSTPSDEALEIVFDPHTDKSLVRLGLAELAVRDPDAAANKLAETIVDYATTQRELLYLLLLTHVAELTTLPLAGLETYADLEWRFDHLRLQALEDQLLVNSPSAETLTADTPENSRVSIPLTRAALSAGGSLAATLVAGGEFVEFGVRRATSKLIHTGLRFRNALVKEGVLVALKRYPVRAAFKQVLGVLGAYRDCQTCGEAVFSVPLYLLRGIDDLRALVCSVCGTVLSKYWLAKGEDVQTLLNGTFLDYELISEWTFHLGSGVFALQFNEPQLAKLTVLSLKTLLVQELFYRYELSVQVEDFVLQPKYPEAASSEPLEALSDLFLLSSPTLGSVGLEPPFKTLVLAFTKESSFFAREEEVLTWLLHKIRTRFA